MVYPVAKGGGRGRPLVEGDWGLLVLLVVVGVGGARVVVCLFATGIYIVPCPALKTVVPLQAPLIAAVGRAVSPKLLLQLDLLLVVLRLVGVGRHAFAVPGLLVVVREVIMSRHLRKLLVADLGVDDFPGWDVVILLLLLLLLLGRGGRIGHAPFMAMFNLGLIVTGSLVLEGEIAGVL